LLQNHLAAYENIPNFPKDVGVINISLYSDRCSVSVGKVLATNDYQISLNTCCIFGASGAPCYGRNQIDRFCAIYLGSLKDKNDRWIANIDNHGLHVDHPHFARAFQRIGKCIGHSYCR